MQSYSTDSPVGKSKSKSKHTTALYKTNLRSSNEEELILRAAQSEPDVSTKNPNNNGSSGGSSGSSGGSSGSSNKEPSLIFCLCRVFGGKFAAGTCLKLVQDLLSFTGPLLLDLIIQFIKDKDQTMSVGLFLTVLLFASAFAQSLILQHYYFRMNVVGARIRTSLVTMIYKKSLRLSTTSRRVATVGEMTNLIAVNAQLFLSIIPFLNMLWSSPLQIVICIYMLWRYLGIAAFAGLATTVIFIPLNVFATDWNKKLSVKKVRQPFFSFFYIFGHTISLFLFLFLFFFS